MTELQASHKTTAYHWYVVGVLTFAYLVSFLDRQILALMVGPIQADLSLSDTQMSLLMGLAFSIFYVFMAVPLGRLADQTVRRNILIGGVTLWSAMTAACGLAGNYWQLFLARMGVGVGEASLTPSATSMIADYFPPGVRGKALATYNGLPKDKLRKVLIEATRDPVLMKRLLEDVKTPKAVRSRDQYFLNAMVSKKILSERERYDIEDSAYGVNNIKKLQEDIASLGKKGLSANRIMAVYELAARNKNENVGEFVLDQVQSILDMSDEERTKIRMRIPKRPIRKRITRPNLQPTNP